MSQIDRYKKKTNLAWEQVYTRLEKDGLLTDTPAAKPLFEDRKRTVAWISAAAALCISLISIFHIFSPEENKRALLTMQNVEDATTLITTLEDGSIVYLGENAALHYPEHFEAEKREVVLEGNAQFDISGNKERPFYIDTKEVQIEVLGTSFQVKSEDAVPFELVVSRGEVKVTTKDKQESCLVKAGEKVQLLPDGLLVSFVDNFDAIAEEYSRYIRFKDEKLGDVLYVLNKRISDTPLSVEPSLADKVFTVAFESQTSPDDIAEVICAGLNLRYKKENDKIMLMH